MPLLRYMFEPAIPPENGKNPARGSGVFIFPLSDRAGNFTGTQTPGTNVHMAGRTIDDCLHALDVGLPGTIGTSVGVGNLNAEGHALVAELALCHPLHLLAVTKCMACTRKHKLS